MQLGRVQHHPGDNGDGLADDVLRGAEEPCGLLRNLPERVVAEGAVQLCATMFEISRGFAWFSGRHSGLVVLDPRVASLPPVRRISGSTGGAAPLDTGQNPLTWPAQL